MPFLRNPDLKFPPVGPLECLTLPRIVIVPPPFAENPLYGSYHISPLHTSERSTSVTSSGWWLTGSFYSFGPSRIIAFEVDAASQLEDAFPLVQGSHVITLFASCRFRHPGFIPSGVQCLADRPAPSRPVYGELKQPREHPAFSALGGGHSLADPME